MLSYSVRLNVCQKIYRNVGSCKANNFKGACFCKVSREDSKKANNIEKIIKSKREARKDVDEGLGCLYAKVFGG